MSVGSGFQWGTHGLDGLRRAAGAALLAAICISPAGAPAQVADLSVDKTIVENPVEGGVLTTYTIVVSNNGPEAAEGVVLNDSLPAGSEFLAVTSITEGECMETSNVVNCYLGTMEADEVDTVTITAVLHGAGQTRNQATVRHEGGCDPNVADNISSATATVTGDGNEGDTNIVITQEATPNPATVGGLITYTVTLENRGPRDANEVVITDTIPSGSELVAASSTGPADCVYLSGTLTCSIGALPRDTSETVILTVRPLVAGPKLNVAAYTADVPSSANLSDNTVAVVTQVLGFPVCACCLPEIADLSLTKTASPNPVTVGDQLTYTITATNNGPSTATNVLIFDDVPTSVTIVGTDITQGFVTMTGNSVTGVVGTLTPAESATLTIVVTPQQAGALSNMATVIV